MASDTPAPYCSEGFKQALLGWQHLNRWSQQDPHEFAKAAGSPGPHNSQWSRAVRGLLDPKAGFFLGLEIFNLALASGEIPGTIPTTNRERLVGSQPLRTDDGRILTAADFFALYVGQLPCPEMVRHAATQAAERPPASVIKAAAVLENLSPTERQQLAALLASG